MGEAGYDRGVPMALLADRGVVAVTGPDAAKLLGGIITNDIESLDHQPAMFAGLLSPQGKLLFDFFIVRDPTGDGFLLDVARDQAASLVKRLNLYKLRAKVDILDRSGDLSVYAAWRPQPGGYPDPRDATLGWRGIAHGQLSPEDAEVAVHRAHRIAAGIPEGGKDYDFGDTFPHEANFDLLNGVSFDKGCYVGQEIVARMEHRGTVRKRIVRVTGASDLPATRPDVKMGEVVIGRLGSVAGKSGLAMLRLDRAIEAIDKGEAITAEDIALTVDPGMIARQRKLMAEKASQA
jgi:folate-binding protein YgfZ